MRKLIAVVSCLLVLEGQAYADKCGDSGVIEVVGTAKQEVTPDVAVLNYNAQSHDKNASKGKPMSQPLPMQTTRQRDWHQALTWS